MMAEGKRQKAEGVPEGWQWKRLSELGVCLGGLTYSPDDVVDTDGLLVLRSSNVQNGLLSFDDKVYVRKDIKVKHLTKEKDILICVRNGSKSLIGKNAMINQDAIGFAHGAFMVIFRAENPEFIYQIFQTSWYDEQVKANLGATINSINSRDFLDYSFLIPPLPEQRKIAAILSTWDDSLATLTNLLAAKRQQKRGLAEALLTGKKRLKGFEGEWEESSLENLANSGKVSLGRGNIISKKDIESEAGNYPIYSSSTKNDGIFGKYGRYMFDEELITWSIDGGGNFFHRKHHKFSVTNVSGFMKVDMQYLDYFWLYAILDYLHGFEQFDYQKKAHPSVIIKLYKFPLPPLPEQQAIASILSTLDGEIASLEALKAKVQEQKRGLMDELLTGRVRVKVEEEC